MRKKLKVLLEKKFTVQQALETHGLKLKILTILNEM